MFTPVSPQCKKIVESKEHVLVGISPFNSYYTREKIVLLIDWAARSFKNFHLFIPDTLPYYNFLAMGYPSLKAHKKTVRQCSYLKNKVVASFLSLGFSHEDACSKIVTVKNNLDANPEYLSLHAACNNKLEVDEEFRFECLNVTRKVIRCYGDEGLSSNLNVAVKYLLGELPLYLNTPAILNVKSSLLVYHERLDFFESLYKARNNDLLAINQGHLLVNFD